MNSYWRLLITDAIIWDANHFLFLVGALYDDEDMASYLLEVTLQEKKPATKRIFGPVPTIWSGLCKGRNDDELILLGGDESIDVLDGNTLTNIKFDMTGPSQWSWRCDDLNIFFTSAKELVHLTPSGSQITPLWTEKDRTTASIARHGTLNGVHGLSTDFLVVTGQDGFVAKYEHGHWSVIEDVPTSNVLVAPYCRRVDEIYVFGWKGTCYLWDGQERWRKIPFDTDLLVYSVAEFKGDIYIATLQGSVFRLENGVPRELDGVCAGTLKSVDDLLIGWDANKFTVFDGHQWRSYTIEIDNELAQALDKAADEREEY